METLKNFLTGLVVIITSLVLFVIVFFTWPLIIGLGSIILSILAGVLFIVLIFNVVILIGYLARKLFTK